MADPSSLFRIAGLTDLDEQIYLLVVRRGRVHVLDVIEGFAIPEDQAAAHLEGLRDRGLISRALGSDEVYTPVDPRYSLGAVTDRLVEQVSLIRQQIPMLAEEFDRSVSREEGAPETRIVSDPGTVASWYVRLQHQATRDIMMFDRPPYVSSPLVPLEMGVIGSGVRWRGLYTAESFSREGAWEETVSLGDHGEESRVVPTLPVKLVIADRSIALVSLSLDGVRSDALITEAPPLVEMLVDMFEYHWSRGLPLSAGSEKDASLAALAQLGDGDIDETTGARTSGRVATREEQGILALIGSGLTDDAIAERLGISVRSLRRRSQRLMTELGATNRFQAGVEAARRGWV